MEWHVCLNFSGKAHKVLACYSKNQLIQQSNMTNKGALLKIYCTYTAVSVMKCLL